MQKRTQEDHVVEELGVQPEYDIERVSVPGVNKLHEKSTQEIGEVLALVLKSRPGVVELHYKVGEFVEIKTLRLNR